MYDVQNLEFKLTTLRLVTATSIKVCLIFRHFIYLAIMDVARTPGYKMLQDGTLVKGAMQNTDEAHENDVDLYQWQKDGHEAQ